MSHLQDEQIHEANEPNNTQDWDTKAMLNNLSFLEKKIHQLQDMIHLIVRHRNQNDAILIQQQQQLITADLTSVIVQLISTAGSLLPSLKTTLSSQISDNNNNNNVVCHKLEYHSDHEITKSDEEADEGENLPPGSYEILQLEKDEILAPHTHFCTICGKGFKRDANLRMHMRGHGDEYKTAAALAKPNKESLISDHPILVKRYSCPYIGCKRNKDHKKFQPLKTILCVKNHYKRTHCDKNYTCSRCNTKKFSVIADLKTHEKHCGRDKWLCSCGTTFSRKDKLFGHIGLFQGHTPAIPVEDCKGFSGLSDRGQCSGVDQVEVNFKLDTPSRNVMDEDPKSYLSPLGYDVSEFDEFPRTTFEDSENSFSFMLSESCDYPSKNGIYNGSNYFE